MLLDTLPVGVPALLALPGAALVAGWVDAVVGGGGLIQLPALLIGLPASTPVPTVAGTNKVSAVFGTAVAAATYGRRMRLDARTVVPLVLCAAAGSALGARAVHTVPRVWFTPLVFAAVVVVGVITLRRPAFGLVTHLRHSGRGHAARAAAIGLVIGGYDGLIGPGTGTFFVMALVAVLGYSFLEATALTKLANLTTNLAAIAVFATHGTMLWTLGLPMAAANLLGGFVGASMAVRHGSGFVRRVFLVVLAVLAVKLGVDSMQLVR